MRLEGPFKFLYFTKWNFYLVNLGKYGCLVEEIRMYNQKNPPEREGFTFAEDIPILPGERKLIKTLPSVYTTFHQAQPIPLLEGMVGGENEVQLCCVIDYFSGSNPNTPQRTTCAVIFRGKFADRERATIDEIKVSYLNYSREHPGCFP
ncbi:hypothetical protein TbrSNM41_25250 (plasmid) [Thermus brockianus]|uniref:Uncharacterized protein n=2 Tax=Thermus brockianus TaxID=56956 RepID=A0ABN6NJK1_THEBO|nr:hypothetical protein TbrSNM41_25250 [Thermus brockianus]